MKVYDTTTIRNVAVVGHGGAGKTQLVSAMLFSAGAVNRGRGDDSNRPAGVQRPTQLLSLLCEVQEGGKAIEDRAVALAEGAAPALQHLEERGDGVTDVALGHGAQVLVQVTEEGAQPGAGQRADLWEIVGPAGQF